MNVWLSTSTSTFSIFSLKVDCRSKIIKYKYIHLYFIATKYLWNYALVEYIDNWTRSYSLVIIYQKRPKIIFNGWVLKWCVGFSFKFNTNSSIIRVYYNICMLISYFSFFMIWFNWERRGSFKYLNTNLKPSL